MEARDTYWGIEVTGRSLRAILGVRLWFVSEGDVWLAASLSDEVGRMLSVTMRIRRSRTRDL